MEKKDNPLTLGKKSNKEIAEWFGIRPQSFSNKKDTYLDKLKKYAEFIVTSTGKIEITKVLIPYYNNERAVDIVKSYVPLCWNKSGYDKGVLVAKKIRARCLEEDPYGPVARLKESTTEAYTQKGRRELYGAVRRKEGDFGGGEIGYSRLAWCKEEDGGEFSPLTPAQLAIVKSIFRECFGTQEESENRMYYNYGCLAENDYEGNEFEESFIQSSGFESKEALSATYLYCKQKASETLGFPIEQCIQNINYSDVPKLAVAY